ncbi:hypothetical protein ACSF86_00085 [Moraxella bovoculi]|uniref:hypothetical protein n=1 Tax=Moraxella bovoculi TaxID=386891 RepID=UPI003F4F5E50
MKTLKLIAPLFALGIGLSVAAHVQATTADKTAVKVSQVTSKCTTGGTTKLTYGFNTQKLQHMLRLT